MKSETVKDLMDCPGAWYGWQPKSGDFSGCGHIVIDPKLTVEAVKWLKRRYWVSPRNVTTDGGLMIDLQIRPRHKSKVYTCPCCDRQHIPIQQ